ncbi:hypothetical protein B0A48_09245 [Cryoendolithus antarcticus]|uniref:RNA polymerase II subunit B1 CTD phosphatase RPAP2 homolog n=1 Tax=Cryoendolithus antarcticus TaxID=1507870 RepID=A0A1V8T233_9PEZI|nr:hypothetical protein B0A48_09245 [Cryoendolithus antarcticus]
MSLKVPVKSILKPSTSTAQAVVSANEADVETSTQHNRNMTIALQHANLLQHRRDLSAQILTSIETLLDYPPGATATPRDASDFLSQISLFQPEDFVELIEERRIDGKCGYALCVNPHRGQKATVKSADWKLGKGKGNFCSEECVVKAKFIRAQLSHIPAWERVPGQTPSVKVPESEKHLMADQRPADDGKAQRVQQRIAGNEELAMERGEQATSLLPGRVMTDQIVEKTTRAPPSKVQFATFAAEGTAVNRDAIEGYHPRFDRLTGLPSKHAVNESDDEDQEDDDDEDDQVSNDAAAPGIFAQADDEEEQLWRDMDASLQLRQEAEAAVNTGG